MANRDDRYRTPSPKASAKQLITYENHQNQTHQTFPLVAARHSARPTGSHPRLPDVADTSSIRTYPVQDAGHHATTRIPADDVSSEKAIFDRPDEGPHVYQIQLERSDGHSAGSAR
jgi:hypothetical protein